MVVLLPLLMAYSLIGENIHEVLGICMFALFIAHHVINRKWWTGLFTPKRAGEVSDGHFDHKGKYNAVRILNAIVNLFLAVFMILQTISGILMSKYVLKEVTISGASSTFRTIHMTLAYWGFIMMSFHLGLHIMMISARVKNHISKAVKTIVTVLFLMIAAYGVYAIIKRGIGDYLLMKVSFAFSILANQRSDFSWIMLLSWFWWQRLHFGYSLSKCESIKFNQHPLQSCNGLL